MKRLLISVISISLAVFVSCTKDDDYPTKHKYLVEITKEEVFTPAQLASVIGKTANGEVQGFLHGAQQSTIDYISGLTEKAVEGIVNLSFSEMNAKYGGGDKNNTGSWQTNRVYFNYNSVSFTGKKIVLSGVLTYPSQKDGGTNIKLDSYSIYSHFFTPLPGMCPTNAYDMMLARILYNSALIEADFEGYGVTGDRPHAGAFFDVLAQQQLDCTLAAKEIMEERGIFLAQDGHSDSWGLSLGAPTALALQRLLEQDENKDIAEGLKFRSTYCSDGPFDVNEMIYYMNDHPEESRMLLFPCTNGIEVLEAKDLDGFKADDFWNPELKNIKAETGESYYQEIFNNKNLTLFLSTGNLDIDFIYHPDMITTDRDGYHYFNMDSPKTKLLLKMTKEHSSLKGWIPRHLAVISHNESDLSIPYIQAYNTYLNLASNYDSKAVFVGTSFHLSILKENAHMIESILGMLRMITNESPEDIYRNSQNSLF